MLFLQKEINNSLWAIWKIDESKEELLASLSNKSALEKDVLSLHAESKIVERLAVRVLLKSILGREVEICYHPSGKPYLEGKTINISISHTKGYVAVIVGQADYLGIDIQYITEKVVRVRSKFMSDTEYISPDNSLTHLLLHWSAKETMYKAIGNEGVELKGQLHINAFDPETSGCVKGEYRDKPTYQEFRIWYMVTNDFVLTYTY